MLFRPAFRLLPKDAMHLVEDTSVVLGLLVWFLFFGSSSTTRCGIGTDGAVVLFAALAVLVARLLVVLSLSRTSIERQDRWFLGWVSPWSRPIASGCSPSSIWTPPENEFVGEVMVDGAGQRRRPRSQRRAPGELVRPPRSAEKEASAAGDGQRGRGARGRAAGPAAPTAPPIGWSSRRCVSASPAAVDVDRVAPRHGDPQRVVARTVEVRSPSSRIALAHHGAGPDLGDRSPVDLDHGHPVEDEVSSSPGSPWRVSSEPSGSRRISGFALRA